VRTEFRRLAAQAGVRRRFARHQLRHAHAREGVPLNIIQRQLGHANLGTTSIYLQGIDPEEIIAAIDVMDRLIGNADHSLFDLSLDPLCIASFEPRGAFQLLTARRRRRDDMAGDRPGACDRRRG
jgi:hypothetical protein